MTPYVTAVWNILSCDKLLLVIVNSILLLLLLLVLLLLLLLLLHYYTYYWFSYRHHADCRHFTHYNTLHPTFYTLQSTRYTLHATRYTIHDTWYKLHSCYNARPRLRAMLYASFATIDSLFSRLALAFE